MQPGEEVGRGDRGDARRHLVGVAGQLVQADERRLVRAPGEELVVRLRWVGAEAGQGDVDDAGIHRDDVLVGQAEGTHRRRRVVGDEHVGVRPAGPAATSRASANLRFSPTERLFADISARYGEVSMYGPCRSRRPTPSRTAGRRRGWSRDSTLTTSAPWNASIRQQLGAAMAIDSSTTDTSSSTPMVAPQSTLNRPLNAARAVARCAAPLASRLRAADPAPSSPALLDAWFAVARSVEVTQRRRPRRCACSSATWSCGAAPTTPWSPPPTAAHTARLRSARAPSTAAACRARTTAGRSPPPAAASGVPSNPGQRATAAPGPPRHPPLRRALRPGVGVPRRSRRRGAVHRPGGRRVVPPDQHAGRAVAHVGDADGRQLPRHQPLPLRPHRDVRPGAGHARRQDRHRRARRRLDRLPLRRAGRQRRPARWPAGRTARWSSGR